MDRQDEFSALVQKYARVVGSAIRRVCARRYRSLIPDVEQEVYAALWQRLGHGKEIEHPASYLYKMALTTSLAVVRRHTAEMTPIEVAEDRPAAAETGFAGLLPPERARLLGEVLTQLPPDQARAVRAHLAGFSHVEVATLYGWSESVARHRIYRAIEALKERMRSQIHEPAAAR